MIGKHKTVKYITVVVLDNVGVRQRMSSQEMKFLKISILWILEMNALLIHYRDNGNGHQMWR